MNSSGVDNSDEKGWYFFFFFTINILKIIWRIDKAFSFIFYLFRQFCLELNGLAVKLQVIFSLT